MARDIYDVAMSDEELQSHLEAARSKLRTLLVKQKSSKLALRQTQYRAYARQTAPDGLTDLQQMIFLLTEDLLTGRDAIRQKLEKK